MNDDKTAMAQNIEKVLQDISQMDPAVVRAQREALGYCPVEAMLESLCQFLDEIEPSKRLALLGVMQEMVVVNPIQR